MRCSRLISLGLAGGYAALLAGPFVPESTEPKAPRVVALRLSKPAPQVEPHAPAAAAKEARKALVLEAPDAPVQPAARAPNPVQSESEVMVEQSARERAKPSTEEIPQESITSESREPELDPSQAVVEVPPKPDDEEAPPIVMGESAGGRVLVLGVRIGADGKALDTRILVPSADTVGDMGYALAASQLYQPDISPPIEPGKSRWITLRIEYPDPAANPLLP